MKSNFKELAVAKIDDKRNIVISKFENEKTNGITLAQQVEVEEGRKTFKVYLKNAIQLKNVDALYSLRDAINLAINELEK